MAIHKTVKMFSNSGFSSFLRLSSNRSFCKQDGELFAPMARSKSFLRTFISESKPSASNANGGALVEKTKSKKTRSWKSYLTRTLVAIGATTYICNVEMVPYSNRSHFVLAPRIMEKGLGEWAKKELKGKILSKNHPMSVRARMITEKLVGAAENGLRDGKVGGVGPIYALSRWKHAFKEFSVGQQAANEFQANRYLDHMKNWEVIVVDDPDINARCIPGGKIIVHTGLLQYFVTDTEIAAIIAHEVGHSLARHGLEPLLKYMLLIIPYMLLYTFNIQVALEKIQTHPSILRLSRKQELEADYIGLMLMASAGYDPRVAMAVKLEHLRLTGTYEPDESKSSHPCGKRRVALIAQAQEEAMALYAESTTRPSNYVENVFNWFRNRWP